MFILIEYSQFQCMSFSVQSDCKHLGFMLRFETFFSLDFAIPSEGQKGRERDLYTHTALAFSGRSQHPVSPDKHVQLSTLIQSLRMLFTHRWRVRAHIQSMCIQVSQTLQPIESFSKESSHFPREGSLTDDRPSLSLQAVW